LVCDEAVDCHAKAWVTSVEYVRKSGAEEGIFLGKGMKRPERCPAFATKINQNFLGG
jgi:hypothetical protein